MSTDDGNQLPQNYDSNGGRGCGNCKHCYREGMEEAGDSLYCQYGHAPRFRQPLTSWVNRVEELGICKEYKPEDFGG